MFKIEGLTFRYPGCEVFRDYHAEIPENALIYGPNGCGKTTLLRLLAGTLRPEGGTILWQGRGQYRVSMMTGRTLLYDDIRFERQLAWIGRMAHRDKDWVWSRCKGLELESLLNLTPGEMSDGMRQWATLAFVCAMPADVYLLDEPLDALDNAKSAQFLEFLKNLVLRGDHFVLTGHSPNVMNGACGMTPFKMVDRC